MVWIFLLGIMSTRSQWIWLGLIALISFELPRTASEIGNSKENQNHRIYTDEEWKNVYPEHRFPSENAKEFTGNCNTSNQNEVDKSALPLKLQCKIYRNDHALCSFVNSEDCQNAYTFSLTPLDSEYWRLDEVYPIINDMNSSCACRQETFGYKFKKLVQEPQDLRLRYISVRTDKKQGQQLVEKNLTIDFAENEYLDSPQLYIEHIDAFGVDLFVFATESIYYHNNIAHLLEIIPENMPQYTHPIINKNMKEKKVKKHYYLALPYPHYNYSIRLKLKSNRARNDTDMWSKSEFISVRTAAAKPHSAPIATRHSFHIKENTVRLYWKEMEAYERNGPNFMYSIHIGEGSTPILTTQSFWEMPIEKDQVYRVHVKSRNELGESPYGSLIQVNTHEGPRPLNVLSSLNGNEYTLTWTPYVGLAKPEISKYTVFWCREETAKRECKGDFEFEELSGDVTSYTKSVEDGERLLLGVAGDYGDYSAGIQWAQCSADISSEVIMPYLSIEKVGAKWLNVSWGHGNCDSIIQKYTLTYESAQHWDTPIILTYDKFQKNDMLVDLTPCTNYNLELKIFSQKENKTMRINKTTEGSDPGEPYDVQVLGEFTTSKSATVSWLPPPAGACKVTSYQLTIATKEPRLNENCVLNKTIEVQEEIIDENGRLSYKLDKLCSYTEYTVDVVAKHKEKTSKPSQMMAFKTLIGKPQSPTNAKYFSQNQTLTWAEPIRKFGPKVYYIVELIQLADKDIKFRSIVEQNSCQTLSDVCAYNESLIFTIRTLSLPTQLTKIDRINNKFQAKAFANPRINTSLCEESVKDLQQIPEDFITSDFIETQELPCFTTRTSAPWQPMAYAFILMAVVVLCLWIFKAAKERFNEMKNIGLQLPEALNHHGPRDFKNELHNGPDSPDTIHAKDGDFFKINANKVIISSALTRHQLISSDSETGDTHSVDSSDPLYSSGTSASRPEKTISKGYQSAGSLLETSNSSETFKFDYTSNFPIAQNPATAAESLVLANPISQNFASGYVTVDDNGCLKMPSSLEAPASNHDSSDEDSPYLQSDQNGFNDSHDEDDTHVILENKPQNAALHPHINNLKNCYVSNGMFGPMDTSNFYYYNSSPENTSMPSQFASSYVTVDELAAKKTPTEPKCNLVKPSSKAGDLKSPLIFIPNDDVKERQLPGLGNIYTKVGNHTNNNNLNYVTQKDLAAMAQNM